MFVCVCGWGGGQNGSLHSDRLSSAGWLGFSLPGLLELGSTICAFHHRETTPAILYDEKGFLGKYRIN